MLERAEKKTAPKLIWYGIFAASLIYFVSKVPSCGSQELQKQDTVEQPTTTPPTIPPPSNGCGKITYVEIKPVVDSKCVSCHAKFASFSALAQEGGDVVSRITADPNSSGRMPKAPNAPLSQNDQQLFKLWQSQGFIESCQTASAPPTKKNFYTFDQIEAAMNAAGQLLSEDERAKSRFLVLTHRLNEGATPQEMATLKAGVNKAVNSLNTKSSRLINLAELGPENSILRLNLDDVGLSARDFDLVNTDDPFKLESFTKQGINLKILFSTRSPWIHADNFMRVALTNNTYYKLIKIFGLNLSQIFQKLGVDFLGDQRNFSANFIGTSHSFISNDKPRLVTEFRSSDGEMWVTFDADTLAGKANRNLFNAPLLIDAVSLVNGVEQNFTFDFSAGEAIFQLRNGMQGFLLSDNKGNLLHKGAITVVHDNLSPISSEVINARACFRCHQVGMNPVIDEVKAHVDQNGATFGKDVTQRVDALYKDQPVNDKLFKDYNADFALALAKIQNSASVDSVSITLDPFELNWTLHKAANFYFLTDKDFSNALNQSAKARNQLGALLTGGQATVALDQVITANQDLVNDANLFKDKLGQ
jgi:hypothetical protein